MFWKLDVLLEQTGFDFGTALEITEVGQKIVSPNLAERVQQDERLGKLLSWRHAEEVAERDGQDGRRLWCTIGHFIYDITCEFPVYPV